MKELQRLERGGYRFELKDGKVMFSHHRHDDPPQQWVVPLMAEVRKRRDEVRAILQARLDWLALFEEWCGRSTNKVEDAAAVARLTELAIAGLLPCYTYGEGNTSTDGWTYVIATYVEGVGRIRPERPNEEPSSDDLMDHNKVCKLSYV